LTAGADDLFCMPQYGHVDHHAVQLEELMAFCSSWVATTPSFAAGTCRITTSYATMSARR
jgi:hypothetical protein